MQQHSDSATGDHRPEEQETLKLSTLLTNAVILHTTLDMRITIRELVAEGWEITLADLAVLSPTWPARIQRFGVYATDEVALPPSHSTPPRLRPGAAS